MKVATASRPGVWVSAASLIVGVAAAFGLDALWPMLHATWSDIYGAFSHGYLVLALCAWLGVRYWRANGPARLQPWWAASVILIACVLALVGMEFLFVNSTRLVLLPLLLLATIALVFGVPAARALFWPCVFLYCALPQWWVINGALQSLTSVVTTALVTITGLSAYVEGNFIHVPAGVFEIASGCSGLSYLIAALSLAGFHALMYLTRWKSRFILLAVAAVVAMISNWIRIYALIVIGILTDMQHYLIRVEHLYFGWALFMVLMVPVLILARRLEDADSRIAAVAVRKTTLVAPRVSSSVIASALVAALILIVPRLIAPSEASTAMQITPLPDALGAYARSDSSASAWQPQFVNAEEEHVAYTANTGTVEVYRAAYSHQTSERRLVRADQDFFGVDWRLAERSSVLVSSEGREWEIVESRGYEKDRERLIWSWYVVAGRPTSSKLGAKLLEVRGLVDRRRDAMAIAVAKDCTPDCASTRKALAEFTQSYAASLHQ